MKKYLLIFDVDCTITSSNTFIHLSTLLPKIAYDYYMKLDFKNWIDESNYLFKELKINGFTIQDYKDKMKELPLTDNFHELFDFCRELRSKSEKNGYHIDIALLSGASQFIIDWLIEIHKLDDIIDEIITYKNHLEDDTIFMTGYHDHDCSDYMIGLCKEPGIAELLEIFKKKKNSEYEALIFVGDGDNDYCAGKALTNIKLKEENLLLARKEHYLYDMLFDKENNPTKYHKMLSCNIEGWENGKDIIYSLKQMIEKKNKI